MYRATSPPRRSSLPRRSSPAGSLSLDGCGINPTRSGFLEVARRMGAAVTTHEDNESLGEPSGTIELSAGDLRGTSVTAEEVPDLIDEVPLLAVLGLFARGSTEVRGAEELRFKESDRLAMIARMAESLGGRRGSARRRLLGRGSAGSARRDASIPGATTGSRWLRPSPRRASARA